MGTPEKSPRRPSKKIIGGLTITGDVDSERKQYSVLEGWNTDLMSPLGSILNFLRERDGKMVMRTRDLSNKRQDEMYTRLHQLRSKDPDAFVADYEAHMREVHLPALQQAVATLTRNDEAAAKVTLEAIESAWKHVEGGGRVARALAKRIVTDLTTLQEVGGGRGNGTLSPDAERAADALSKDERFVSIITSVGDQLYTTAEAGPAANEATLEVAHTLLGVARDVFTNLQNTGVLAKRSLTVWKESDATHKTPPEKQIALALTTLRGRFNGDLSEVASRLLHEVKVETLDGDTLTGLDLLRMEHGNFSLIGTKLETPARAARSFYAATTPADVLIADAPFTGRPGEDAAKPGIANPVSRIIAELHLLGEHEEADPEAIKAEIDLLKKGIVNLCTTADARKARLTGAEPRTPFNEIDDVLKSLTFPFIRKLYGEAKKAAKSGAMPSGMSDDGLTLFAQEFPRIQRIFTHLLLTSEVVKGKPSLKSIILGAGGDATKDLRITGAWQDNAVLEKIVASDREYDPGAKQLRVESFIRQLPEIAEEAIKGCRDCAKAEKEDLLLLAKSFTKLCIETYVQRVREESAGDTKELRKKAGAKISANLMDSFADAYQTLFAMKLVAPLAVRADAEAAEKSEKDARKETQARIDAATAFQSERQKIVLKQLRELRARLSTGEDLRGNFAGTLAFAMAPRGTSLAERKKVLASKMQVVAAEEKIENERKEKRALQTEPYMVFDDGARLLEPSESARELLLSIRDTVERAQRIVGISMLTNETSHSPSVGWKSSMTGDFDALIGEIMTGSNPEGVREKLEEKRLLLVQAYAEMAKALKALGSFTAAFAHEGKERKALAESSSLWYRNAISTTFGHINILEKHYYTALAFSYIPEAITHLKESIETASSSDRPALEKLLSEIQGMGNDAGSLARLPIPAQLGRYKRVLSIVYPPEAVAELFTLNTPSA